MFTIRAVVVVLFVAVLFAGTARAALPIEFEFRGVFTQVTNTVHQVGEPFTSTVRFDPEAVDTDPLPSRGRYTYISWIAPYRTAAPIVLVPPGGAIEIDAATSGGSHGWRMNYFGASQFRFELAIDYPRGTFQNEALPLTLDLSQATATRFEHFDGAHLVDLRGTINSLTVRVVPEPRAAGFFVLAAIRRTRRASGRT